MSDQSIPAYIVGDRIKPRIRIRHKRHIVGGMIQFVYEQQESIGLYSSGAAKFEWIEGDSKISVLLFRPMQIEPKLPVGLYNCQSLHVKYADGTDEMLSTPENLKFRIIEDPADTPEVAHVEWGDPNTS